MKKHKKYLSDKFNRRKFLIAEKKRKFVFFLFKEYRLSDCMRLYILITFNFFVLFSKFNSISLLRTRCTVTNHSRSVDRSLRVSRHIIRKYSQEGKLLGFKKNE